MENVKAIDAFYIDSTMQAHAMSGAGDKQREKKLGDVWERFKGASSFSPGSNLLTCTVKSVWEFGS